MAQAVVVNPSAVRSSVAAAHCEFILSIFKVSHNGNRRRRLEDRRPRTQGSSGSRHVRVPINGRRVGRPKAMEPGWPPKTLRPGAHAAARNARHPFCA